MIRALFLIGLASLFGCDIAGPPFTVEPDPAIVRARIDAAWNAVDMVSAADAGEEGDAIVFAKPEPDADLPETAPDDASEASAPDAGWCSAGLCGSLALTSTNVCVLAVDGGASLIPTPDACRTCSAYTCACVLAALNPPCAGAWGCSDSAEGFGSVRITCD